jgi:hypothetical protein
VPILPSGEVTIRLEGYDLPSPTFDARREFSIGASPLEPARGGMVDNVAVGTHVRPIERCSGLDYGNHCAIRRNLAKLLFVRLAQDDNVVRGPIRDDVVRLDATHHRPIAAISAEAHNVVGVTYI